MDLIDGLELGAGGAAASTSQVGKKVSFGGLRQVIEETTANQQIQEIAVDKLQDNPYQHYSRSKGLDPATLNELADSIRTSGFFGALVVRPTAGGNYQLAYGHRRREASRLVGLTTLPVKVVELTDRQMYTLMAAENFSREELTAADEVKLVGLFEQEQNMKIPEIATAIGKSQAWVRLRLAVYHAPPDIRQMVEQHPATLSHADLLIKIRNQQDRAVLIEAVLQEGLSFEQLSVRVRELLNPDPVIIEAEPLPSVTRPNDFKVFNDDTKGGDAEPTVTARSESNTATRKPARVTAAEPPTIPVYHNGSQVKQQTVPDQEWRGEITAILSGLEMVEELTKEAPLPHWVRAKLEVAQATIARLLTS